MHVLSIRPASLKVNMNTTRNRTTFFDNNLMSNTPTRRIKVNAMRLGKHFDELVLCEVLKRADEGLVMVCQMAVIAKQRFARLQSSRLTTVTLSVLFWIS